MLNTLDITKYIAACAKKAGMAVVWEEEGCPRTDGRTMWLPCVDAYADESEMVQLRQFVKHETSHVLYSDFDLLQKNSPQGLLAFVNNLLEDHRIDYLNDKEYSGDKTNTEAYWPIYEKEMVKSKTSEDAAALMFPLFAWDFTVRSDLWYTASCPFTKRISAAGKSVLDKLLAGDYADVLRNIRNIKDKTAGGEAVFELAKRIVREVFDADPDKMQAPQKSAGKEGGKGKRGEGDEGEGSKEKADGKGSDDKAEDGNPTRTEKLRTIDCDGAMMQPYSKHDSRSEGVNATNYTCGEDKTYTPTPADDIIVHNFVTGETINTREKLYPKERYSDDIARAAAKGTSLAHQVRTQLQIICRDRYEYGKKRGKLHNGALYRVGMKDAKGLNERLFKQKIENQSLDVAVQVVCDASGSMSGEKFTNAAAAAVILNDVISNALHIPLEILAFTEWGDKHTMFIAKEFSRKETGKAIADSFSAMSEWLLDNVDGESLVYSFNRLRQRKEKRKLMIVLSDGCPCGGHEKGNIDQYTRGVIRDIERSPVEIVGVGIKYDGVRNYYKRWSVIEHASRIEESLLSLISQHIIRSV